LGDSLLEDSMKTIGADEAKARFSELLADVANGETVVVTKHGVPVAHIVPVRNGFADARKRSMSGVDTVMRTTSRWAKGSTIRELIEEGRE
jgi:prevent-host-death family protein